MSENNDTPDVKIARLEEKIEGLIKAVDKVSVSLENLRTTFVPRSEFDRLSVIVVGVANEGGLLKRIGDLEDTSAKQKGAWSTVQVFWVFIIGIISVLGALGFYITFHTTSVSNSVTHQTTTSN